jgi:hypothetical protein
MSGEYEKAISIGKAIQNVVSRTYLLHAKQRKFTWKTSQIEVPFDLIMRGYPINTFMTPSTSQYRNSKALSAR